MVRNIWKMNEDDDFAILNWIDMFPNLESDWKPQNFEDFPGSFQQH